MPDPSPLPPQSGTSTTDLIGVPAGDFHPPTHQASPLQGYMASGISGMRTDAGFSEQQNQFNSNPNAPQYHNGYEWTPASHPETIPTLQAQLIEAGLLKAGSVRPGVWDQTSANAYKSALALANVNGGTDTDAIQFLIDNQKLAGAQKQQIALDNPADVKLAYQNAAEQLTGGDLPASEADAFLQQYQKGEMLQAGTAATGGTYTKAMGPEAFIKANQGAAVESYSALQKGLEFYRMLNVI